MADGGGQGSSGACGGAGCATGCGACAAGMWSVSGCGACATGMWCACPDARDAKKDVEQAQLWARLSQLLEDVTFRRLGQGCYSRLNTTMWGMHYDLAGFSHHFEGIATWAEVRVCVRPDTRWHKMKNLYRCPMPLRGMVKYQDWSQKKCYFSFIAWSSCTLSNKYM